MAMLTIRDEQFQALAAAHLETDLVRYLRERFPTALAEKSDADLNQIARSSREIGGRHGITEDRDIGTVADLVVMYGVDFEHKDWAREVLDHPEMAGAEKMELLRTQVRNSGARI